MNRDAFHAPYIEAVANARSTPEGVVHMKIVSIVSRCLLGLLFTVFG